MDADRIESGGLWNFNSHLLVLRRLHDGDDPKTVSLSSIDFWVLVHDLPRGYTSEVVVAQLENFIGQYLEFDSKAVALGFIGTLRVRGWIDVEKSLKRRKKIMLSNGTVRYVRFSYEKLTLFCFLCEKLGHGESFCSLRVFHAKQELSFGWDTLRALFQ